MVFNWWYMTKSSICNNIEHYYELFTILKHKMQFARKEESFLGEIDLCFYKVVLHADFAICAFFKLLCITFFNAYPERWSYYIVI